MGFDADVHIGRNMVRRIEVVSVDDSGEDQLLTVMGLEGEFFELTISAQDHGLSGVPPVGAVGLLTMINGRPDTAQLSGMRLPGARPTGQAGGETKLYGQAGNFVHMKENGDVHVKPGGSGIVHLNPPSS